MGIVLQKVLDVDERSNKVVLSATPMNMDAASAGADASNVSLIFTPQVLSLLELCSIREWQINTDAAWWTLKTSADFPGDLRNVLPSLLEHLLKESGFPAPR